MDEVAEPPTAPASVELGTDVNKVVPTDEVPAVVALPAVVGYGTVELTGLAMGVVAATGVV